MDTIVDRLRAALSDYDQGRAAHSYTGSGEGNHRAFVQWTQGQRLMPDLVRELLAEIDGQSRPTTKEDE